MFKQNSVSRWVFWILVEFFVGFVLVMSYVGQMAEEKPFIRDTRIVYDDGSYLTIIDDKVVRVRPLEPVKSGHSGHYVISDELGIFDQGI